MALWGWRVNRMTGWALSAFATLIVIGSIHLLWHYAVDGIAGAILAAVFWAIAGKIAHARERHLASRPMRESGATPDVFPA